MTIIFPIILTVLAFFFLILSLLIELSNDGDEAYDNATIVCLMLSITLFFIGAATFLFVTETAVVEGELIEFQIDSYIPIAWLDVGLAFIPIVFLTVKAFDILGSEEE